jgi:uncharacterized membrane protein YczE
MISKYFCREYIVKTVMCIAGVSIMGTGVGIMRYADFGIDPFMSMVNGVYITISRPLGIDFGTSFLLFTFVLLLVDIILDKSQLGVGTIVNMVITGYAADFGLFLFNLIPVAESGTFYFRIAAMFLGVMLIAIGSGIYFNTHIGVSPYDAVGLAITAKTGNQKLYRWVRIGTDIVCITLGFFMGSMPGTGTIIMALFAGPLFAFFRDRFLVWGRQLKVITW